MPNSDYTIRPMTRPELDLAVEWAAAEGWNPGLYDADSFYAADPTGFLIGLLNDEPIAVISVVKYGQAFGFLGFYIVRPEYRGQGYGEQLLRHLAKICVERNYGRLEWSVLDWNVRAIDFYKSLGAKPMDDWTVFRVTGEALARLGST